MQVHNPTLGNGTTGDAHLARRIRGRSNPEHSSVRLNTYGPHRHGDRSARAAQEPHELPRGVPGFAEVVGGRNVALLTAVGAGVAILVAPEVFARLDLDNINIVPTSYPSILFSLRDSSRAPKVANMPTDFFYGVNNDESPCTISL